MEALLISPQSVSTSCCLHDPNRRNHLPIQKRHEMQRLFQPTLLLDLDSGCIPIHTRFFSGVYNTGNLWLLHAQSSNLIIRSNFVFAN